MTNLRTVRGTHDILDDEFYFFDKIIKIFESRCLNFNYRKISTPILESSNLFIKTLGEVSDIVSKEMFNFIDQGGESLTLRPEGTAPIARALISNSLYEDQCQKFFYSGPMFRRERPQAGRLRQFNQFGVEYFNQSSFLCDLEVIFLANLIIKSLDIENHIQLEINSIGNSLSRSNYINELKSFFENYKNDLSPESQKRLLKNPLRILDSKSTADIKITENAPNILDFLDDKSLTFYKKLKDGLSELKINYNENPNLVRGLDYYNHSVFEFKTIDEKKQNTLIAGGRYDGLVKSIGNKDICGVGWAAGIERIILLIKKKLKKKEKKIISLFTKSEKLNIETFKIMEILSDIQGISINTIMTGSLKKKFSKADKQNSFGALILSEEEFLKEKILYKDFTSGSQNIVDINSLKKFILNTL